MLLPRLGFAVSSLCKINRPTCLLLQRCMSKNPDDDLSKPLSYSESQASRWKAEYSRVPPTEMVWYTTYVVTASVASFMLYFCILREENDLDELIYRPLPETLKGIDRVFPNIDFYTKPDYVRYHEEKKKEAQQAREGTKYFR